MYEKIPEVKDSKERKEAIVGIQEGIYAKAEEQLEADKFFDAKETFQSLGNYSDAKQRVKDTEKARQDKIKLLCANQRYAEALHFQNLLNSLFTLFRICIRAKFTKFFDCICIILFRKRIFCCLIKLLICNFFF